MRLHRRRLAALAEAVRIAAGGGQLSPSDQREAEAALVDLGGRRGRGGVGSSAQKRRLAAARAGETSGIRAEVERRAGGRCEHCGAPFTTANPPQMDHFEGRRKGQSVETCWMLDLGCHRQKTENRPFAAYWLMAFIRHAMKHGYAAATDRARRRLDFVRTRELLGDEL